MRPNIVARGAGTATSVPVECCGHAPLDEVLSLGYMPPVKQMVPIGAVAHQPWFPTAAGFQLRSLGSRPETTNATFVLERLAEEQSGAPSTCRPG